VSADQIFVLLLVVGIVCGLGWLSWQSRRREQLEAQQPEATTAAIGGASAEVKESMRRTKSRRPEQ